LTGVFGTNVRVANLQLGTERIQLVQFITPKGRSYPDDSRSNDNWFQHAAIVVQDMDAAYDRLSRFKIRQISTEPQRLPDWNKNAAGIKAFYFRDPDRHPLELIYFPPGKGDRRWHQHGNDLFLGIDHTAVAVEDTDRSLGFYRDALGFHVAGESLNYGTEQEHLNHVFGSRTYHKPAVVKWARDRVAGIHIAAERATISTRHSSE
jgi:catechol 2,3-dioxygenase-like lactoylglutathione lyase family enzyme